MAKMSIIFNGFADLAAEIDRSGGDLVKAVDEALTETAQYIQDQVESAAAPYATKGGGMKGYATGEMYKGIKKEHLVTWHGSIAEVGAGFNLENAWWSIFVMYGTPRMAKDPKVYNAIKGTKTKKAIEKLQQEVMQKYLNLEGNGHG